VNLRIRGILKLLQQHVAIRIAGDDLFGALDRCAHAERAVGEDQFRAQRLEHLAPLDRHSSPASAA
jgi:nitrite reductase/ring-hydroxylating ferredoxin subunit